MPTPVTPLQPTLPTPKASVTCEIAPVTTPIASSLHEYTSGDSGLDISLSQFNSKFELTGASATCGPIIFDIECAVKAQITWVPSWCSYDEVKEEFTLKTPKLTDDFELEVYLTAEIA